MIGRNAFLFSLLALLAISVRAKIWAAEPGSAAQVQLVVLRNGEVLSGTVSKQADRYVIASEGTEIRLASRDVDFLCQTLDEAYNVQRSRIVVGRIEDHLNLADWCIRQKLLGDAAREIAAAMNMDPKNPRVVALDNRLQRELQPDVPKPAATDDAASRPQPVSGEELERLVRSLPTSTVETFTSTIQPMLLNYCATAGCHGPSSASSFTLIRSPYEKIATRRLTERNLYNTLLWVDHENPLDSKLLAAAREPHGPNQASGSTGVGTVKYQELTNWVLQAMPHNASVPSAPPASMSAAMYPLGMPAVLASPAPSTVLMPNYGAAGAGPGNALGGNMMPGAGTAGGTSGMKTGNPRVHRPPGAGLAGTGGNGGTNGTVGTGTVNGTAGAQGGKINTASGVASGVSTGSKTTGAQANAAGDESAAQAAPVQTAPTQAAPVNPN